MATRVRRRYSITMAGVFALGFPLIWLTIARAAAPDWSPVAPMTRPRALATATALADGRVLVAGGADTATNEVLRTAEIFDPATDTWSSAGTMSENRYYHTATALADGRVLVAGGTSFDGVSNTVEIYDPASMTWSPAAPMTHARGAHAAVTLHDGRVLVVGGVDDGVVDLSGDLYDPVTNSWSLTGPTNGPRVFATAQVLPDGRVLAAGGYDPVLSQSVDTAEIFDPATSMWAVAAPMNRSRLYLVSVPLTDGRILVIGGAHATPLQLWADGEIYDPASGSWTLTSSTGGVGGMLPVAARRTDGRVLAVGGVMDVTGVPNNLAGLYDPATNTWSQVPPMSRTRWAHFAIPIPGGRTLVAGGVGAEYESTTDQAETFGAPNNPPLADAGGDQTVQGCAGCLGLATLDGSGSSDPDGDALTYAWSEGATILATTQGATTSATVALAVGTHTIVLTVADGAGGTATDTTVVVVEDAVGSLIAQVASLEANLAEAHRRIEGLTRELAELRADHRELTTGVDTALSNVERDMQREFRNPRFTIPGRTPLARLRHLAEAIIGLNHGHKQALYRELGGR